MSASCAYCRMRFASEEAVMACPACATEHHQECFDENCGCTVFGCTQAPPSEPKLTISDLDVAPDQTISQPASILHLGTAPPTPVLSAQPACRPVSQPTPPPPRLGPPSPSQVPAFAGFSAYGNTVIPVGGYIPDAPRKNRITYVLLAIFFGWFGVHNFYAGYTRNGIIQVCITVLTCFFGSIVSWIWAIVEACTVERDSDGNAFL